MVTQQFTLNVGSFRAGDNAPRYTPATSAYDGVSLTDIDTAGADLVTALGTITYSSTTHQFSGSLASNATVSSTNGNAAVAALNTAFADVKARESAAGAGPAISLHVRSDVTQTQLRIALADMMAKLAGCLVTP